MSASVPSCSAEAGGASAPIFSLRRGASTGYAARLQAAEPAAPLPTEIQILGLGAVSRAAVETAARRHPGVRFTFLSRQPERHPPFSSTNVSTNVAIQGLDGPSMAPLIFCAAADEASVLRDRVERGLPLERAAVAPPNLAILASLLPRLDLRHRRVVVVTNPVELLCEALRRWTGATDVYGFGMTSDHDRVLEALRVGFELSAHDCRYLDVTGLHFLRPIPAFGRLAPRDVRELERVSPSEIARRLTGYRSPRSRAGAPDIASTFRALAGAAPQRSTLHQRLQWLVSAITASEFDGSAPPRARAADNLASVVSALVEGRTVRLSGLSSGRFVGGALDPRTGRFTVPPLTEVERELLAADLQQFDQLKRRHLS